MKTNVPTPVGSITNPALLISLQLTLPSFPQCDEKELLSSSLPKSINPLSHYCKRFYLGPSALSRWRPGSLPPQGIKTIFDFLYQHIQFWFLLFCPWSASRLRVRITQQTRVLSPKRDACFRTFPAKVTGPCWRFFPFFLLWEASSLRPDGDFLEVWRYKFWSSFSPVCLGVHRVVWQWWIAVNSVPIRAVKWSILGARGCR